jgi:arylsulfatase A-like enzyme
MGKWHIGGVRGRPIGFGHVASFAGQGRYLDCPFWIDGQPRSTSGHVDDVATQLSIDFLRRPRAGPFLLVLGFKGAHAPREPPARFEDLYRDAEISWPANLNARPPYPRRQEHAALAEAAGVDTKRFVAPEDWQRGIDRAAFDVPEPRRARARRRYYETLAGVDDNVGRVLDALDELSLADDTLVVYVSDNGAHLYAHGMADKRSAYEESMRVLTLVRYPKHARPDTTIDELVLNVDLAPTLLDFAGLPSPETVQGASWRGLLEDRSEGWRDAFVYEFYGGARFLFVPSLIAIRTREAKWIDYLDRPSWAELFDLVRDPGETLNLAGEAARGGEIDALQHRLAQLEAEIGPRYRPPAGTPLGLSRAR